MMQLIMIMATILHECIHAEKHMPIRHGHLQRDRVRTTLDGAHEPSFRS